MANSEISPTSEKIRFKARASFLKLDKPKAFEEGGDPRWEAAFLLNPADAKQLEGIKTVVKAMADISKQAYGVVPLALKTLAAQLIPGTPAVDPKTKDDGIEIACYNGDKKDYDGYAGMFVIPSHNSKMKPAVANRKGVSVDPGEEQYPYSGCYVIGSITLWAQVGVTQKKYGKRIGVNLRGVQFDKDGDAFGAGDIAPDDEFDALEDEGAPAGEEDLGFE
jgi:hypothetical protein